MTDLGDRWGAMWHAQPAAVVKRLLAQIPDEHILLPNEVRNFAILDPAGEYVGYVELGLAGSVKWFDDGGGSDGATDNRPATPGVDREMIPGG